MSEHVRDADAEIKKLFAVIRKALRLMVQGRYREARELLENR